MTDFWDRRTRSTDPSLHGTVSDREEVVRLRDRLERAHFDEVVRLRGSERVLDLGAGAGRIALWLAPRVAHVTLVDASAELVNAARERALRDRIRNVAFVKSDLRLYQPAPGGFDLVIVFGVATHLDDEEVAALAAKCARALAPGGRLVLKEPVTTDGVEREDRRAGYVARFRPRERYAEIFGKHFHLHYQAPTVAHPIPFFLRGTEEAAEAAPPAWVERAAPLWERSDRTLRAIEAQVRATPLVRRLLAPVPVLQDLYVMSPAPAPAGAREPAEPALSVVVIAYNEEECLEPVVLELATELAQDGIDFELVLVDDGSSDRTLAIMQRLATHDARLRVVPLSPNRGIGGALRAGFDAARGRHVTWVPADGQIDPQSVKQLYFRRSEAPMLTTVYAARDDAWYRHAISTSLNTIIRLRTGQVAKSGGNYLFTREAWQSYAPRDDDTMMISTAFRKNLAAAGERVVEVPIRARARVAGSSKVLNARTIARTLAATLGMSRK